MFQMQPLRSYNTERHVLVHAGASFQQARDDADERCFGAMQGPKLVLTHAAWWQDEERAAKGTFLESQRLN